MKKISSQFDALMQLRGQPLLLYTGAPYTAIDENGAEDKELVNARMDEFMRCNAALTSLGFKTVTPLYAHYLRSYAKIPGNWAYWGEYSELLLKRCDALVIVMIDGWDTSIGVLGEIEIAKRSGINIYCIDPSDLG